MFVSVCVRWSREVMMGGERERARQAPSPSLPLSLPLSSSPPPLSPSAASTTHTRGARLQATHPTASHTNAALPRSRRSRTEHHSPITAALLLFRRGEGSFSSSAARRRACFSPARAPRASTLCPSARGASLPRWCVSPAALALSPPTLRHSAATTIALSPATFPRPNPTLTHTGDPRALRVRVGLCPL